MPTRLKYCLGPCVGGAAYSQFRINSNRRPTPAIKRARTLKILGRRRMYRIDSRCLARLAGVSA